MRFFLLIIFPFCLVWLWTKNRNRAFRWLGFGVVLTVQIFSLMPVGAIVFALYASPETESAAAGNNYALGKMYGNFRVTQGHMHGLPGWEGVDISGGCGSPIYAPFGGKVTYKGLDGYNHIDARGVVYDQNTMLTIQGENGLELTLLHGDYRVQYGDTPIQGDLLGYESSIGWSTGCHSHVILKDTNGRTLNFLEWQVEQKQIRVSAYDYRKGVTNCDSDCSTMASGDKSASWLNGKDNVFAAACPGEWAFGTRFITDGRMFECRDRGGWIKCYEPGDLDIAIANAHSKGYLLSEPVIAEKSYCWVDLMAETKIPYGTLTTDWRLIQ